MGAASHTHEWWANLRTGGASPRTPPQPVASSVQWVRLAQRSPIYTVSPMKIRVAVAGFSLLLICGGAFAFHGAADASRGKVFTVELSERGFNPQLCRISRDNYVQFKNVGTTIRRVILPGVGANAQPAFDSGDLKPGDTSNQQVFPHGGTVKFHDNYKPELTVTVLLPVFTAEWEDICTPLAVGPAPTPPASGCPVKGLCAVVLPSIARDR